MNMKKAVSLVIVGVGGQGILTFSEIIGRASLMEGRKVVMSEVHGMSQRGGVVVSEMKIGEAEGALVGRGEADFLVGFEPMETCRALEKASAKTWILTSTDPIVPFTVTLGRAEYPPVESLMESLRKASPSVVAVDAHRLAREAGGLITVNSVMLGALSSLPRFPLKKESLLAAMRDRFGERHHLMNEKAFRIGENARA